LSVVNPALDEDKITHDFTFMVAKWVNVLVEISFLTEFEDEQNLT